MIDETSLPVPPFDPDKARRRSNKLFNERLKLMATFFNGVGIASLVAYIIIPFVSDGSGALSVADASVGLVLALLLHILGQVVLTFFKSED